MANGAAGLSVNWSEIDGTGLVRVIRIDGFRDGFEKLSAIAEVADTMGVEPDVHINSEELTIVLEDPTDETNLDFAHELDTLFE